MMQSHYKSNYTTTIVVSMCVHVCRMIIVPDRD